MVLVATQD